VRWAPPSVDSVPGVPGVPGSSVSGSGGVVQDSSSLPSDRST
jgi:hypothetical protein